MEQNQPAQGGQQAPGQAPAQQPQYAPQHLHPQAPPPKRFSMLTVLALVIVIGILVGIIGILIFTGFMDNGITGGPYDFTEAFSEEYQTNQYLEIEVTSTNGLIEIVEWSGSTIELEGLKKARTAAQLDDVELVVTETDTKITFRVTFSGSTDKAIDLRFKVPGWVTLDGVKSTNGAIDIIGEFLVHDVENVNGLIDMDIGEMDEDIEISTTNGLIVVNVLNLDHDIDVRTTNGAITVNLESYINAEFEMFTTNGGLTVNHPDATFSMNELKAKAGDIGTDGNMIEMRTTNGSVILNEI